MIDRMPRVGEYLQIEGREDPMKVIEIDGNIVIYDHWLKKYKEWNRVIARFDTNSAGEITWNPNLTIVSPTWMAPLVSQPTGRDLKGSTP